MKKILSLIFTTIILILSCCILVSAVSNNDSASAVRKAFKVETDPSIYEYDYYYYSPVKDSSDETKYPIILWLHGQLSGDYPGDQIRQSDIAYLATVENQTKIKKAGGAFILVPRYPTLNVNLAWVGENATIKKFVDGFIAKHKANVDTNRIYVGGYSMGGKAAMSFAAAYPNYVAAIFPASSIYQMASAQEDMRSLVNTPMWFFTCKDDNFWGKPVPQTSDWNYLCSITNQKDSIRWTQFEKTLYNYDGSLIASIGYKEHNVWDPILHDLIMKSGSMYPNMTTIDGNGKKIVLSKDDSFLSWLSSQSLNSMICNDENGHDMGDYVITTAPTCTTVGIESSYCSRCNYTEIRKIAMIEHIYNPFIDSPTCLSEGCVTYICACGDRYEVALPKTEHSFDLYLLSKYPSCTQEGEMAYFCKWCELKDENSVVKLEKLPHNFKNGWQAITLPTCINTGVSIRICNDCLIVESKVENALGHNFNGSVCTTCGYDKADSCTCNCHKTGILALIWKILNFFYRLLRLNPTCNCGIAHY